MRPKLYLNECRDQTILNNGDPFRIAISFNDIEMDFLSSPVSIKEIGKIDLHQIIFETFDFSRNN